MNSLNSLLHGHQCPFSKVGRGASHVFPHHHYCRHPKHYHHHVYDCLKECKLKNYNGGEKNSLPCLVFVGNTYIKKKKGKKVVMAVGVWSSTMPLLLVPSFAELPS
jgi:hypothetical protein